MSALLASLLLAAAPVQACPALPAGLAVPLVTVDPLSSKKQATGDMVALRTAEDVVVDGVVVIPKGTDATGQISNAQATGGLGVNGKLAIAPLYLRVGAAVVRLTGATQKKGTTGADTVAGLYFVPIVSGKSANIPAGTALAAEVLKPVTLCPAH
jgi:hypothetical protein